MTTPDNDDTPDAPVVDINSIPPIPDDDLPDDDREDVPAPELTPEELAESEAADVADPAAGNVGADD